MTQTRDLTSITPGNLQVGMYVVLPSGWLDHPFLRNQFQIKDPDQLKKLQDCGFENVRVDLKRSKLPKRPAEDAPTESANEAAVLDPKLCDDLPQWNPDNLVPEQLLESLHDKKIPPEQRSKAVYSHSRELMNRLLESPTAENLKASKQAISSVTDLILSDDATAINMLRITDHDFYTYTHSVNVGVTSIMVAKALFGQSDRHDMHELGAGFFLHDLGKVNIRQEVINKPGRLDDTEMRHMRTHPYKGFKLLEKSGQLSEESRIIILQHHERADGSGYPKQLHDREIHIYGKICCIADVYDALTAERSYKKALQPFEALKLMKAQMADHFNKELFERFVMLMGGIPR
ncbi:HD-GYP domain-containing protein [Motiliproteus coralliicola]|uniref:HD-GYP domain-containing protein n=1 Tax=Motiliproteus coralliicola TaxID=2283196 RepID=A0A369WPX5_9GAMM|nr:HD-GYP domain-containing protein [Motiliproteus coralliicola]RDE24138.1 HD-GYP domain-containing protein [Motiliproteus coralliicola]